MITPPPKYPEIGKTVSLLFHLTKMLHGKGKILVLYDGLFVIWRLVDMEKK